MLFRECKFVLYRMSLFQCFSLVSFTFSLMATHLNGSSQNDGKLPITVGLPKLLGIPERRKLNSSLDEQRQFLFNVSKNSKWIDLGSDGNNSSRPVDETSRHLWQSKNFSTKSDSKVVDRSLLCDVKIVVDYRFVAHFPYKKSKIPDFITMIMNSVDYAFGQLDADEDGVPDNIGFHVSEVDVRPRPIGKELATNDAWNPLAFFLELALYDFRKSCAGLLFTHRKLPEKSLLPHGLPSKEQGICSSYIPPLPLWPHDDYGPHFSNALPVNVDFSSPSRGAESLNGIVVQTLHQLAHLFGAPDDPSECTGEAGDDSKRYLTSYPPPSGAQLTNWHFSDCAKVAIGDFLRDNRRPCLRACNATHCAYPTSPPLDARLLQRTEDPRRVKDICGGGGGLRLDSGGRRHMTESVALPIFLCPFHLLLHVFYR